jgi:hypothetical protein
MNFPSIAMFFWAGTAENHSTMDTILKVAPLVPVFVAAVFKLAQDHGRETRKTALIDAIAKLAKNIADLPELPDSSATARLRDAFHVELEHAYAELRTLQTKAPRRTVGLSSITAGLRSAFLLYRPRGVAAWLLHLSFYTYLLLFALITLGLVAMISDPRMKGGAGIEIFIYTLTGIPPLLLWYFAMKIHRRQCAAADAAHAAKMTESVA